MTVKKRQKSLFQKLKLLGIDPKQFKTFILGYSWYLSDYKELKKQLKQENDGFKFGIFKPCLNEKTKAGGTAKGHYFHQDLLIAQRVFERNPEYHVDVGSRVDGFVAHIASFREITILDIRNISSIVKNIKFLQADLMNKIPEDLIESTDSLSCLHALEHFGLGRYGDDIVWNGHIKGFNNLYKILRRDGILYISVPIGKTRIEFNAHRIFSVGYIIDLIHNKFKILNFSYVDDKGDLFLKADLSDHQKIADNFGCEYGCGIFELQKL